LAQYSHERLVQQGLLCTLNFANPAPITTRLTATTQGVSAPDFKEVGLAKC